MELGREDETQRKRILNQVYALNCMTVNIKNYGV
jgi:hypothetical protein